MIAWLLRQIGRSPLPYAIGGDPWPGISKLAEESGEVIQVLGKIIGTGGAVDHWDGTNLRDRITEELGDQLAAIEFFIKHNDIDMEAVRAQRNRKAALFEKWHEAGAGRERP